MTPQHENYISYWMWQKTHYIVQLAARDLLYIFSYGPDSKYPSFWHTSCGAVVGMWKWVHFGGPATPAPLESVVPNVLFNDALSTLYLPLYGIVHMVKDKWDNERGNPLLPLHGLLFQLSSKGGFICTIQQPGSYIPQAFLHTSCGIRNSRMDPPEGISLMTHHTMSRCSSMTQCLVPVLSEADYRSHFSLLTVNGLRSVPSTSSVH